jgi:zinc finger SWIM domain-containing protein 3
MGKAIGKVFTESYHGLCTFHIMQNIFMHLSPMKGEKKDEGKDELKDEDDEAGRVSYLSPF